ncbi:MAG TPA: hypothetical protein DDY31_15530, partial [Lachnospiraceae bacterium]|nr:hypothetical protein [Lachnospiraceae bacterium]
MARKKIWKPVAAVLCIFVLAGVVIWQRTKQKEAAKENTATDYPVEGSQLQKVAYPAKKEEQELDSAYLANLK